MKVILLLILNFILTYGYNCSICYNTIKNNGLSEFCGKVLNEDCSLVNIENTKAGVSFCGMIVNDPCN